MAPWGKFSGGTQEGECTGWIPEGGTRDGNQEIGTQGEGIQEDNPGGDPATGTQLAESRRESKGRIQGMEVGKGTMGGTDGRNPREEPMEEIPGRDPWGERTAGVEPKGRARGGNEVREGDPKAGTEVGEPGGRKQGGTYSGEAGGGPQG